MISGARFRGAVLCASLVALGSAARAAKPVVVIAPFRGEHASAPQDAVVQGLKRVAVVLSARRYEAVARGILARTQKAEDLAAVAHELGAKWIVTGTFAREAAHWALGISLRDGATGHVRSRLRYNLTTPRCPPTLLRTLGKEIVEALAEAQQAPPDDVDTPRPAPTKPSPPPTKVPVANDDDEAPPRAGESARPKKRPVVAASQPAEPTPPEPTEPEPPPKPKPKPKPAATEGRPKWARWFELGLGPSVTGRSFSTNPQPPRFSSSVVGGLHADLVAYPFAFSWNKLAGVFSGFGLSIALDKPIWPDSTALTAANEHFPTNELRVEGGMRWKFTLYKPMPRPQLTLIVEGGVHEFTFARGPGGTDLVGVPDVEYVYVSIGGGFKIHFAEWSWIWADFVYHVVTNFGPIDAPSEYGRAMGYGLRVSGGLDFLVWKGIRVGAQGFYEHYNILFGYPEAVPPLKIADGASDDYYGAILIVGYVF